MAKQFDSLNEKHKDFISSQKLFFVATAMPEGRINLSPKGYDTLKLLSSNRLVWLNLTGSGNETATHIQQDGRMTLMFIALEGAPLILRLYGRARVIHLKDSEWPELYAHFTPREGVRQIFDFEIEMVQSSCGFAIPRFTLEGARDTLARWAEQKGEKQIKEYWLEKNQVSIDGIATKIASKGLSEGE